MSNEIERNTKEMKSLFSDPKFARNAFRSIGAAIAYSPCSRIPNQLDKNGDITLDSAVETYSYNQLKKDINKLGAEGREPTELELIIQCQMVRARFDTAAAVFIRDSIGAKPVDETKLDATVNNPYENLTDEELELLAKHREAEKATKQLEG